MRDVTYSAIASHIGSISSSSVSPAARQPFHSLTWAQNAIDHALAGLDLDVVARAPDRIAVEHRTGPAPPSRSRRPAAQSRWHSQARRITSNARRPRAPALPEA